MWQHLLNRSQHNELFLGEQSSCRRNGNTKEKGRRRKKTLHHCKDWKARRIKKAAVQEELQWGEEVFTKKASSSRESY